jgi:GNAT superfamily N-acetyltransferase
MMVNIVHIKEEGEEMDLMIEKSMEIINLYPEIFPHLYKQGFKLVKRIKSGNLILEDGVLITFTRYENSGKLSPNAKVLRKKGDYIIHQIASDKSVKGATKKVLDKFVEYCRMNGAESILLTVRAFNEHARKFYERYGFVCMGDIKWNSKETGEIAGVIYKYNLINRRAQNFFNI